MALRIELHMLQVLQVCDLLCVVPLKKLAYEAYALCMMCPHRQGCLSLEWIVQLGGRCCDARIASNADHNTTPATDTVLSPSNSTSESVHDLEALVQRGHLGV